MNSNQKIFILINVIGGLLVLASYYWGLKSDKGVEAFWGGVPKNIRGIYTIFMLLSAAAFFLFSAYVYKNLGSQLLKSTPGGVLPYLLSFAIIQLASTLWMPLVDLMVSNSSTLLWIGIRIALAVVGLASVVIFVLLLKVSPKQSDFFYYSTLVGLSIFIFHTGVLDAVIWPYFWKK